MSRATGTRPNKAQRQHRIAKLLEGASGPKSFVMTVNAGAIPAEHWTQDRVIGGGRIVGEGCHFIDLLRFLAGSRVSAIDVSWTRIDSLSSACLAAWKPSGSTALGSRAAASHRARTAAMAASSVNVAPRS